MHCNDGDMVIILFFLILNSGLGSRIRKGSKNEVFRLIGALSGFEDEPPEALINNIPSFLTPWHFHILVGSLELAART